MVALRKTLHNISSDCNADVSSAGYKYLASRMNDKEDPDAEQSVHDFFLAQLDEMEALLGKHAGPYLVGWALNPLPACPYVNPMASAKLCGKAGLRAKQEAVLF